MRKVKFLLCAVLLIISIFSHTSWADDYINSIGMKFKNIPAGSFYMGSCQPTAAGINVDCPSGGKYDYDAAADETPQHKVRFTKGFQIGVYEVTLRQFKKFIDDTGEDALLTDDFIKDNKHGDNAAVTQVSWNDVQAFIQWLNKKEGGNAYRLPSEAEWEYAVRAGTTTKFSWGNINSQAGNYAWRDEMTYGRTDYTEGGKKDYGQYAHVVGGKEPNPWGLYDMHGNVWEWVQDWYDENYYQNSPVNDPKGAKLGRHRVIRGGCWGNFAWHLRSAIRGQEPPDYGTDYIGFRLVRQPL